ncbi:DUF5960 family protein [Fundicoccus sp. Sow4_D5]|uniref:DUF5960 family protein n=1 Tax=Fundicoccus sp. Sow4_D5 TaxID=3438782 RepID=UPI003F8E6685
MIEFDYQSENYRKFSKDFYTFSSMSIPLPFVTDHILKSIANIGNNYFLLNYDKSNDKQNHYFMFTLKTTTNGYIYEYIGHRLSL